MKINKLENYFLRENKIFRKKYFCKKNFKMYYEKELKIQKIKKYEYVLIDRKLHNIDKIKMLLNPL
jgi:hypothetical protein